MLHRLQSISIDTKRRIKIISNKETVFVAYTVIKIALRGDSDRSTLPFSFSLH